MFKCKIPFLNGGLFDPMNNYDWKVTDILLPNELFSNSNKTKEGDIGNGIVDIFDRYNFTVKEDEPLEKEVAIDPEMLGKVYEKFNAIRPDNYEEYKMALKNGQKGAESKFNKQYGVYYTPREIVHYMCQQSLINYLATELENKVSKEVLEFLILRGEEYIEYLKTAKERKEEGKSSDRYEEHEYFIELKKYAQDIDEYLSNIKVCDPAIGSGAFPVGMMTEIIKARLFFLETRCLGDFYRNKQGDEVKRNTYNYKRDCIQNSLYGVDIDSGAVEIAKLRLWLSLIVDEEDIKNIKPLPNLDYKIVRGNSLLGIEKNLLNEKLFSELERLKLLYFNETNPSKKQEYKNQISNIIDLITNWHKEFDFKVYFSEVFHEKKGFDVVIANPPYGANMPETVLKEITSKYAYYDRQKNSASFFIEIAVSLIKDNGNVCYIIPKSFSFVEGWKKTRDFVTKKNTLKEIIDVSKAFEDVLLEQVIIFYKKSNKDFYEFISGEGWNEDINIIGEISSDLIKQIGIVPIYALEERLKILNKILQISIPLSSITRTFRGLPFQSKISEQGEFPVLRGKNITRYAIYGSIDRVSSSKELMENDKVQAIMKPKIISQNIVAHVLNPYDRIIIMASFDKDSTLTLDTVMNTFLTSENFTYEYILALLNSQLASWFYYWFVYNRAVRTMHFDEYYIGKLPIKDISLSEQQPFIALVDKILAITKDDDYLANKESQKKVQELEGHIDQMVYKLYELTEEEIKIVEGVCKV
jgi:hypothetical protein